MSVPKEKHNQATDGEPVDIDGQRSRKEEKNSGTFDYNHKRKAVTPVKPVVFFGSAIIIISFAAWCMIYPNAAENLIGVVVGWVADIFGWYYILTATLVLFFVIVVACGRTGRVKLGPDHSKPKYNIFTWTSMLFAAGIGIDLMFFSVSGPVSHYLAPPEGLGGTDEAARQAVIWTLFHYGVTGWGMYTLMGLVFGLFAYRYNLPLSIRATLYPIFGKRINGLTGDTIEIAAVLGTIFGIATSLGIGVVQLNFGLHLMFGLPLGLGAQISLIVIAVAMATASTVSGVDKGIRRLSELNVLLAFVLMLYVLFTGETKFLLNALVQNIGDFVSRFPGMTLNSFAYGEAGGWLSDWTLFFWAWWIAWAPFVGLFLARISRGRTIRQFVTGTLTIPFLFILIWISIFGNSSLAIVMGGNSVFGDTAMNAPEQGFYTLLEQYPGAPVVVVVATFLGLLFYVTSADSGALVMSNFTSKVTSTNSDGPSWMRIFWAFATGALTLAMLMVGGVTTLQYATVIIGLPFSIVLYLFMIGLYRVLRRETLSSDSFRNTLPSVLSGRAATNQNGELGWRRRIARVMSYPDEIQTRNFMDDTVRPAYQAVQNELEGNGANVQINWSSVEGTDCPSATFIVNFTDACKFTYQVLAVPHSIPSFASSQSPESGQYFRIQVFTQTGSEGYDIFGFTRDQLIADLLDNFERYVELIHLIEESGAMETASWLSVDDDPAGAWKEDLLSRASNPKLS